MSGYSTEATMADTEKQLDCRGGVHSDDVVLVFTGRAEPRRMCGYHVAQQEAGRKRRHPGR